LLEQLVEDEPWITYAVLVDKPDRTDRGEPVDADLGSLAEAGFSVRQVG